MKTFLTTLVALSLVHLLIAQESNSSDRAGTYETQKASRLKELKPELKYELALEAIDYNSYHEAIGILKSITEKDRGFKHFFYLAYAQHNAYQFYEAIQSYQKYSQQLDLESEEYGYIEHLTKQAENGFQELMENPQSNLLYLDFQIESNLQQKYLMLDPNNNSICFSIHQGRKRNALTTHAIKMQASFDFDVQKLELSFNQHFRVLQFFNYGKSLLLLHIKENTLYKSDLANDVWSAPQKLVRATYGRCISSATIDNSAKKIVFAQLMPNGDMNLLSSRFSEGKWTEPEPLNINSEQQDCFPQLTGDGRTLFFSSSGHNSVGGFDIFYSYWDDVAQNWSQPTNAGFPINTPADDLQFAIHPNGASGVLLSDRLKSNQLIQFNIIPEFKTQR